MYIRYSCLVTLPTLVHVTPSAWSPKTPHNSSKIPSKLPSNSQIPTYPWTSCVCDHYAWVWPTLFRFIAKFPLYSHHCPFPICPPSSTSSLPHIHHLPLFHHSYPQSVISTTKPFFSLPSLLIPPPNPILSLPPPLIPYKFLPILSPVHATRMHDHFSACMAPLDTSFSKPTTVWRFPSMARKICMSRMCKELLFAWERAGKSGSLNTFLRRKPLYYKRYLKMELEWCHLKETLWPLVILYYLSITILNGPLK